MDQQLSSRERYEHGMVLKGVQMYFEAIDDFQKAALDPGYAGKAHVQIALCLRSAGRPEEAVMEFRQALATRAFSPEEERHILYQMGQTLESLGRHEESLEVYEWIRKEAPAFGDVARRMKSLSAGDDGTAPGLQGWWQAFAGEARARAQELRPYVAAALQQTGEWLSRKVDDLTSRGVFGRTHTEPRRAAVPRTQQAITPNRPSQPAARDRRVESRRHPRVPVRLRSHFSTKGRMMKGEGELRDLSPWGCRVTSHVSVPVGTDLECCIFPQDAAHPFIIDGATVRWINSQEFGLAFTQVRPGVQRQIAQLCRVQAA